jgi:exodeoxyribonuclease-3
VKIVSWNVNGLVATMKHNPFSKDDLGNPDIVCFQEIRTDDEPTILPGYHHFWNHAERKGYAGTAMLTKADPIRVSFGFGADFTDNEGRAITAEFPSCYVIGLYVPNSQKGGKAGLKRQAYRMSWDSALYDYVEELCEDKPVILCGDFNLVRSELDFFEENMRQHWAEQGYASDEQSSLETLLELGLTDVFRELHPTTRSYTWWSNRLQKRGENRGWRLDYFIISRSLLSKVKRIEHLSNIPGSDHCPILLEVSV